MFYLVTFASKDHLLHKYYAVKFTCSSRSLFLYPSLKSKPLVFRLSDLFWICINSYTERTVLSDEE